jgi:integrase
MSEQMPKHTRLMRRGAGYYCRAKVPADLVTIIGKREIQRTLQTSKHSEAVVRVKLVSAEIDAEFAAARRKLNGASNATKASEQEAKMLAYQWFNDLWQKNRHATIAPAGMEQEEFIEQLEGELVELTSSPDDTQLSAGLAHTARQILETAGFERPDLKDTVLRDMMELIHRGTIEVTRRSLLRAKGDPTPHTFDPAFASDQPTGPAARPTTITFQELASRFMAVPEKSNWTKKTEKDYEAKFRLLGEIIGTATPLSGINREVCRKVQTVMLALPPNATKRFPGKSSEEAGKLAAERNIAPLAPKTVNQHLHLLSSLFDWGRREGLMAANPAEGLHVADRSRDIEKRHPFSPAQLQAIFSNGAFKHPDPSPTNRDARFWVPLIGLYSGCRLGEICQLLLDDVVQLDDVWCFKITEEGETGDGGKKSTKTNAAKRIIPVHPRLIEAGFLTFYDDRKDKPGSRLFPEVQAASDGYYSGRFSKQFSYYLKSIKAKTGKTSFHSFRHNFADAVKEADLPHVASHYLAGWRLGTMLTEQYGSSHLRPNTLYDAISKIEYPELNLSHFIPN